MAMNMSGFRPMKSASPEQNFDFSTIQYPVWASPKIDGIRCVIHPEYGAVSNTLKPIPNDYIRSYLKAAQATYLDGELVVGDPDNPKSFNQTQSGVMSQGGKPDFTFLVFDNFEMGHTCGYGIRKEDAKTVVERIQMQIDIHPAGQLIGQRVRILEQTLIETHEQLLEYELKQLTIGYEGVMLRNPQGKYKFGRSTLREQGMIKIKRFRDDEAIIIGWEPLELNQNAPSVDALGLQKRGYSKDGKVVDDSRVGRFRLRGIVGSRWEGVEFWCGSGLDDAQRTTFREELRAANFAEWWGTAPVQDALDNCRDHTPIGKTVTFKYQEHGSIDAPRTPIWKGIRYDV